MPAITILCFNDTAVNNALLASFMSLGSEPEKKKQMFCLSGGIDEA
ncbi:hypothetical protein MKleb_5776 (plasmid) [Klebsiella sp. PL-2018]|nr:hypothetical protein MKleb_5776 [Klebsiella sp. PL-2018]